MIQLIMLGYTCISLVLLGIHSYRRRGLRLTLTFFLFAVIAGIEKEGNSFFGRDFPAPQQTSPFFFPAAGGSMPTHVLLVILGWAFVFYVSWALAERILERVPGYSGRIFTTVLIAGMVAAAVSYALETTALELGLWQWVFSDTRLARLFVGKTHLFALAAWFYFTAHFLAAYFLVECSRFRRVSWKALFLLVYLVRTYTIIFSSSTFPRECEEYIFLACLMLLALFSPLSFDFPPKNKEGKVSGQPEKLTFLPEAVIIGMALIVLLFDAAVLKRGALLYSLAPLIFFIFLAHKRVPLYLLVLATILLIWIGREKAVLAAFPLLSIIVLSVFSRSMRLASGRAAPT